VSPEHRRTARPAPVLSWVDLVDTGAALVTSAVLVVVGLGITGAGRVGLALVFVSFVPGWAVLDYVPLAKESSKAALAVALSLTLSVLGAASVLWLHLWHPGAMLDTTGTLCLMAVVWRLAYPGRRPRRQSTGEPDRTPVTAPRRP